MKVLEAISISYNVLFSLRYWLMETSYDREFVIGGLISVFLHVIWGFFEISKCRRYYRSEGRDLRSELKLYQDLSKTNPKKDDFPDCLKRYDSYLSYTAYYGLIVIAMTVCHFAFFR